MNLDQSAPSKTTNINSGMKVGSALLFYGCETLRGDDLYRSEFDAWEALGVVSVGRAFRSIGLPEGEGEGKACRARHVQERIWRDREEVAESHRRDARLFFV